MKRQKKVEKNKILYFILGAVGVLVIQWLLWGFSYPVVRIVAASGNVGEKITVFYKEKEDAFNEQDIISQTIKKSSKATYYFEISEQFECLRIDLGSSEGEKYVYSIEVLSSPFRKKVIDISKKNGFGYSEDVESVRVEGNALVMTSAGSDPFFVINDVSLESTFYLGGVMSILLSLLLSFIVCFLIIVLCKYHTILFGKFAGYVESKRTAVRIIMIMMVVGVFFSLPVLFTYDSSTYLAYLDFFDGRLPLGQWGKTRGWGFPVFLWLSKRMFGGTAYGISIALFFIYLLFLVYAYRIMFQIEKWKSKELVVVMVGALFLLNPIFLGYYHLILTEGLAATISCFIVYKVVVYHKRELKGFDLKRMCVMICQVAVSSMFLYFVKQMFFVIPLIAFVLSEILLCVTTKKRIWKPFLGLICSFCVLISSVGVWNDMIDSDEDAALENHSVMEQMNISSSAAFSSYLKKGALYFEESGDTILVVDDGTIKDKIEYDSSSSFEYVLKCFFSHPLLLLKGYVDNYLVLANVYTLDVPDDYHMSEADIIKDVSFTRGLENMALALYPRYYDYIDNTYDEFGFTESLIPYGQYVDTNIVTEALYSKGMITLSNFLYSISIIYAPISFLIHLIVLLWNFRKKQYDGNNMVLILSGTVMLYGLAMSMMCMRIDRYMFPVLAFGLMVILLDLKNVIGVAVLKGRTFQQERRVTR